MKILDVFSLEKWKYAVFLLRNPDQRFYRKLHKICRPAVERFMRDLAAGKALNGKVLELGAGERRLNESLFSKDCTPYIRTDLDPTLAERVDCTDMPFKDNELDGVICSEVLEHVPDCLKAVDEIHRVLKPGGKLVLTVPFIFPLHARDYWRFTPRNLEYIFSGRFNVLSSSTTNLYAKEFPVSIQMLLEKK